MTQQEASLVEEWREGVEDMLDSEGLSDQLRGKLMDVSALHIPPTSYIYMLPSRCKTAHICSSNFNATCC
jgi:hypothetical protein